MVDVASIDYLSWYRQYPGKELQVLFYSSTTQFVIPDGILDGFTAKRPSASVFNLKSSGLRANHSAVYYCAWSLHNVKTARVVQTPSSISRSLGKAVELRCTVKGESSGDMFWYRQYPGKELQLMFYSAGAGNVNEEGAADGFTATRPSGSDFKLESATCRLMTLLFITVPGVFTVTQRDGAAQQKPQRQQEAAVNDIADTFVLLRTALSPSSQPSPFTATRQMCSRRFLKKQ
ncbi:hypothetical protein chiPu_0012188 [Chiloscyllium punctatum]|uniref:Immunoglobulin V-set domain-containing protein n=1 Tax=Chiloscyllium punctatum TaxID=137246 RepID=A0A401STL7_CHIPU|nr:hypothetical protein [Chiloscyllium punctatum]